MFAQRLAQVAESATMKVAAEAERLRRAGHDVVDFSVGEPDFPTPEHVKAAGKKAIDDNFTRYTAVAGVPELREAICARYLADYGITVSAAEVLLTFGGKQALFNSALALIDPGDEVIVLEPFYENYGPDAILAGARPVFVSLEQPNWRLNPETLRAAFSSRTKAIVVNTPQNPSGRVFTRDEMTLIADLCKQHGAWAITDEIYEHIRYAGEHHVMASWPGMRERTITISGLSKTFSCTGWRLGYAVAPPEISVAIRKVHDFLTVGAPAPLQAAGAIGMAFDADYYNHLAMGYRERRDVLVAGLREAGFKFAVPEGAYYILADFSDLSDEPDDRFAKWMAQEIGVAPVPGSSFYHDPALGRKLVRFAFCKKLETLERAAERLVDVRARV
jgi:aspartate/methionine/tyrosine aminotransferase